MMKTILIVDDEPLVRQTLGRMIARRGYRVETAADTRQAYLAVRRSRPDAVIVDVLLGAENGWEIVRNMRETARDVALVVTTGAMLQSDMQQDAELLGARAILPKPYTAEELSEVLERLFP